MSTLPLIALILYAVSFIVAIGSLAASILATTDTERQLCARAAVCCAIVGVLAAFTGVYQHL